MPARIKSFENKSIQKKIGQKVNKPRKSKFLIQIKKVNQTYTKNLNKALRNNWKRKNKRDIIERKKSEQKYFVKFGLEFLSLIIS